eukprot:CAMPEP_0178410834 /NCGR_PEP_ID=MMETSP0689_2-20121128/21188_1 /TAXON_ID=160604 /ORGANISM="Amphidinium massartii, Strain CS-259" /LENGTH=469 /DNA_ID=CAMNT_0020032031 /DNA_START=193 /DNA_END=1602 /DNA_ORIENTATION=+
MVVKKKLHHSEAHGHGGHSHSSGVRHDHDKHPDHREHMKQEMREKARTTAVPDDSDDDDDTAAADSLARAAERGLALDSSAGAMETEGGDKNGGGGAEAEKAPALRGARTVEEMTMLPEGRTWCTQGQPHTPGTWLPEPVPPPPELLCEEECTHHCHFGEDHKDHTTEHAKVLAEDGRMAAEKTFLRSSRDTATTAPILASTTSEEVQTLETRLACVEARTDMQSAGDVFLLGVSKMNNAERARLTAWLHDNLPKIHTIFSQVPRTIAPPGTWLLKASSTSGMFESIATFKSMNALPAPLSNSWMSPATTVQGAILERLRRCLVHAVSEACENIDNELPDMSQILKQSVKDLCLRRKDDTAKIIAWLRPVNSYNATVYIKASSRCYHRIVDQHLQHSMTAFRVEESSALPMLVTYYRLADDAHIPCVTPLQQRHGHSAAPKGQSKGGSNGKGKSKGKPSKKGKPVLSSY